MASVVTFVISLYLSKCTVVAFLLRLTKQKSQIMLYWISLGVVTAIGIASLLLVTIAWPMKSGYYWAFFLNDNSCTSQV